MKFITLELDYRNLRIKYHTLAESTDLGSVIS